MCWLYFVPNLLVIQQLETLYLGGNNVRVVFERVWRIDQMCAFKSILATGTRSWFTNVDLPEGSHMWSMQENEGSWQLDHYRTKKYSLAFLLVDDWNSQLIPIASHSPKPPVLQKNDLSHSFSYPTINNLIPTKCRELLEKILRDKPREQ